MNVLLVKSRSVATKNAGGTPPLGLLYLASFLRERQRVGVHVLDLLFHSNPEEAVRRAVLELEPAVVGISALTAEAFMAHRVAAIVKAARPDTPVVIGGPHATSDPDTVLGDPHMDVVVIGEGEETFLDLVQRVADEGPGWNRESSLGVIRGIAFRSADAVQLTEPRPVIENLDAVPFPAWDLVEPRHYWSRPSMSTLGVRPYLPIFTSRGCPYRCVYCHQIFGKGFRARSAENVADEVETIRKLGVHHVEVLDDNCNLRPERFDRLLQCLLDRNLRPVLSFPNALRADLLREESIDLLEEVGVGEVSLAFETASPRLQRIIRKNLDLERARAAARALADRHIFTRGFFMMGFPGETREELHQTIEYARSTSLHLALFFTVNPYRNTELHRMFLDAGKMPESVRTIDYEYYGSPFNGSEVADREFRALYRLAYLRFYGDPARLARIARDRPYWSDIPRRGYQLFSNLLSFRRLQESRP